MTDELFDLTTMAMEYFKEHIEPNLPEITYFGTDFFDITTAFSREYNHTFTFNVCAEKPNHDWLLLGRFLSVFLLDLILSLNNKYMTC